MKSHLSLTAIAIAVAIVVALSNAGSGRAQEKEADPFGGEGGYGERGGYGGAGAGGYGGEPAKVKQKMMMNESGRTFFRHMHRGPSDEIRQAAEALRDAEDEEAKEAATKKLTDLLDEYFKKDMARREQELKDLEDRLEKLRAQLDRRREKKREIVDLQLKVVMNEAEGLGFYGGPGMPGPLHLNLNVEPPLPPGYPRAPKPAPARTPDRIPR